MTDTTITITQEERAEWLKDAQPKSVSHYEPIDFEMDKRIRRLLTALEAAEKALLKEEVYSEELESQLQDADSEYNANWAVQAISDVARLVGVLEQCQETGDDIGAAVIEAVQDLKAENARLTAELETARQLGASAHATAQAAWGGEIPSPLPGHKHMTEDDLAAMDAHLDCPLCGGSGHIGDCDATAAGEVARLRAERGWLAENAADRPCAYDSCPFGLHRPTGPDDDDCDKTRAQCWQEAACRAVAAGEGE